MTINLPPLPSVSIEGTMIADDGEYLPLYNGRHVRDLEATREARERILMARIAELEADAIREYVAHPAPAAQREAESIPKVGWLSNVIREVDGKHSLGAGVLAEKIVEAMLAAALTERDKETTNDWTPPPAAVSDGWKEAAIAWETCASIHRKYAKGRDALFSTRQRDFVQGAEKARSILTANKETTND